jgi:hypothetical protein
MSNRFRHLSYANVVATLALVIAVGGGVAYAANTIFSTDIVNGEVKTADLDNGAVTTGKVRNGQVGVVDLAVPLNAQGDWTDTPEAASTSFKTVLTTSYTQSHDGVMIAQALVEADNTANSKSHEVTLRMLMDGVVEEGVYTSTVPALGSNSVVAVFFCDGIPLGAHTVEIQAAVDGTDPVNFEDRSLNVELMPG